MKRTYISIFTFLTLFLTITFYNTEIINADDPSKQTGDDPGGQIASVLCNVISIAQGNVGKTIAILVIISIAIGLFLGKITWGCCNSSICRHGSTIWRKFCSRIHSCWKRWSWSLPSK